MTSFELSSSTSPTSTGTSCFAWPTDSNTYISLTAESAPTGPYLLDYEQAKKLWKETNRWYYNSLLHDLSFSYKSEDFDEFTKEPEFYRKCFMRLRTFQNIRRQ